MENREREYAVYQFKKRTLMYLRRVWGLSVVHSNALVSKYWDDLRATDAQAAMHEIANRAGLK